MQYGYHLTKISKGKLGTISKVVEEMEEYVDATRQGNNIMAMLELADMYGALEALAKTHRLSMNDLKTMSDATKRAFETGQRKAEPETGKASADRKEFVNALRTGVWNYNSAEPSFTFQEARYDQDVVFTGFSFIDKE